MRSSVALSCSSHLFLCSVWDVKGETGFLHMQTYRSGHNGAHSKCVSPSGLEGSNPSVCAQGRMREAQYLCGSRVFVCTDFPQNRYDKL